MPHSKRVQLSREEDQEGVKDVVVNKAFDTSGFVRIYLKQNFNFNSIDNDAMDIISNVHYGERYNNAYWDGDEMTYGDGDGLNFRISPVPSMLLP